MKVKELKNKLNDIDENLNISIEILTDTTPDEYKYYSIDIIEVCNFTKWSEYTSSGPIKRIVITSKLNIKTKETNA